MKKAKKRKSSPEAKTIEPIKLIEVKEGLRLASVKDVAKAFKITERTMRTYVKDGKIKITRIGKTAFITEANLDNFIITGSTTRLKNNYSK